jgi:hypothetical protein
MTLKLLFISICSLFLSGCFYQTANHIDIQRAIYFCDGASNIVEVDVYFNGFEHVLCIDGTVAQLSQVVIETNKGEGE